MNTVLTVGDLIACLERFSLNAKVSIAVDAETGEPYLDVEKMLTKKPNDAILKTRSKKKKE